MRSGNLSPRRFFTGGNRRLLSAGGNRRLMHGTGRRRRPGLVGIDIGTTRVALVELEADGAGHRVRAFGVEPLAETREAKDSNEDRLADADAVGKAVAKLAKRARVRARRAATAVGGASAVAQMIELDSSFTDEEVASQIEVDADRHLPFPVADAAIDFEVGDLSPNDPAMAEVLLAACPRDEVERCSKAVSLGGFQPVIVDVRMLAMRRALAGTWSADAQCTALLELSRDAVAMALFSGAAEVPLQCREDASETGWGLAEETAVESVRQRLARLQHLLFAPGSDSPTRFLVAGESVLDDGMLDMVREETGAEAEIVQPFANMTVAKGLDAKALDAAAPELLAACGLALRRFEP